MSGNGVRVWILAPQDRKIVTPKKKHPQQTACEYKVTNIATYHIYLPVSPNIKGY